MFFKYSLLILAPVLLFLSCVEKEEHTFTYVVEGSVGSVLGKPVPGIQVVMHRSYTKWQETDTAYTDNLGKYNVIMTLTSRQRIFALEFSDPGIVERPLPYKDTIKKVTYPEQRDDITLHQRFVLQDTITLHTDIQVNL